MNGFGCHSKLFNTCIGNSCVLMMCGFELCTPLYVHVGIYNSLLMSTAELVQETVIYTYG